MSSFPPPSGVTSPFGVFWPNKPAHHIEYNSNTLLTPLGQSPLPLALCKTDMQVRASLGSTDIDCSKVRF